MYIFVRRGQLAGGQARASMMWATEITERVRQVTGLDVLLYGQFLSADVGELGWSTMVPDMATLETAFDKCLVDDFYIAEQDRALTFMTGPPTDSLQQIVHGEAEGDAPPYATSITTTCRPGMLERGLTNAVELAMRADEIAGTRTLVTLHETGPFGTISWLSGHPGIESLDAAQSALRNDSGWAAFVDERVRDVYAEDPMISTQVIHRRIV